jgi:ABC-type lipoprotein export system ATPase subunit
MVAINHINGAAVRAENVAKHYRMGDTLVRAVDNVSMEIQPGEFVALLGSSGSGKSTMMNLIAGLDRPTGGAIFAMGRNLAEMDSAELAKHRSRTIGIVFQAFNLLPRMTLAENVELPLRLAEVDREDRAARVNEAIERVNLSGRAGHRPTELSGGEQQRVALARALVNRPTILLADEPTGNLDSKTGDEIMALLTEINQSMGVTILMVTHEQQRADRYARRSIVMKDGKVISDGGRP